VDTLVSYLISIGMIVFGIWIVVVAAKAASGSLLVWTIMGLMPVVVGLFSLFSEIQTDEKKHSSAS
jgi:hypothetical protein